MPTTAFENPERVVDNLSEFEGYFFDRISDQGVNFRRTCVIKQFFLSGIPVKIDFILVFNLFISQKDRFHPIIDECFEVLMSAFRIVSALKRINIVFISARRWVLGLKAQRL